MSAPNPTPYLIEQRGPDCFAVGVTTRNRQVRTYGPQDWFIPAALDGTVIVDIGQIAPDTEKALNKLVRTGTLLKWRGKWFPIAGASWGLGPDKTCWGLASKYGAADEVAA